MKLELMSKIIISIMIILISSCFIYYGCVLINDPNDLIVFFFGLISIIYGSGSIMTTLASLIFTKTINVKFINLIGIIFLIIYIIGALDSFKFSGFETSGLIISIVFLTSNWLAIKYVQAKNKVA